MAAKNEKKKLTFEDKFARHFYCQRARLGAVRQNKHDCTHKMRQINKEICRKALDNQD